MTVLLVSVSSTRREGAFEWLEILQLGSPTDKTYAGVEGLRKKSV